MSHLNPFYTLEIGWEHRRLIARLAGRRIAARYRGSLLGTAWLILQPLLELAIYTLVFAFILKVEWSLPGVGRTQFATVYFCGYILFRLFADAVSEAPALVLAHTTHIKQSLFPSEVLSWAAVLTAMFDFGIRLVLLIGLYFVFLGPPPATALYIPLIAGPVVLAALGTTWFFSSLGVYLRDLQPIVSVLLIGLMFLSPIFYPATEVPANLLPFYRLNPFAALLEMARQALFSGMAPDASALFVLYLGGLALAWLGWLWFGGTKRGFADVI